MSTQSNAENTLKENYSIVERKQIEGTPFWIVKSEELWYLVMAEFKISSGYETAEEAEEVLNNEMWLVIMHMIAIVMRKDEELKLMKKEIPV